MIMNACVVKDIKSPLRTKKFACYPNFNFCVHLKSRAQLIEYVLIYMLNLSARERYATNFSTIYYIAFILQPAYKSSKRLSIEGLQAHFLLSH